MLRARWKCPCGRFVVSRCVCVSVFGCVVYTRLLISWTKATSGDLRVSHRGRGVFFTSCLALVVSRARGEALYPLMNWDCWSKVWIIEFLINYPELLSDKSAPLQPPPSSSVVFYLIWSASCSPGLPFAVLASSMLTLSWRLMLLCVFWCQWWVLFSALVFCWFAGHQAANLLFLCHPL